MALGDIIFGNYTQNNSKAIKQIVSEVSSHSLECKNITNNRNYSPNINLPRRMTYEEEAFYNKTLEFRKRLRNGETLDDIMAEALSVVREAIYRKLDMYPYDTQIEASIAMMGRNLNGESRENIIAEMKTGEGKTLVQILVAYLNALDATKDEDPSKWSSVHIMTSNDALALRDSTNNRRVFDLLGLSCGFVPSRKSLVGLGPAELNIAKRRKQDAYKCDIVYATTSTIAFDYLNDNTIYEIKDKNITKEFTYAIVDEADDLLIDQAANPLILSSNSSIKSDYDRTELYKWATMFLYGNSDVRKNPLSFKVFDKYEDSKYKKTTEDYVFYSDENHVYLKDRISNEINFLSNGDSDLANLRYMALQDCILARHAYLKDVQYGVVNDRINPKIARVVLISSTTGRNKESNKYMNGIQEAIEAKEEYFENNGPISRKRFHIELTKRNTTKAMCTYPDFLGLYSKRVCGMTGTSDREEFKSIYGFETYEVPPREKNIRIDEEDEIYLTKEEKYKAILNEVVNCYNRKQPVLIGTTSVSESKEISYLLSSMGILHNLLNAENESEENKIIENAGKKGMVTVSTNMAGRGTDIKLGEGVRELGGLYVIGTSKNNSVRIDKQLRGRAGRQGDPGKTKFFSSLEDNLVKLYYPSDTLSGFIEVIKDKPRPLKDKKSKYIINKSQSNKEGLDKSSRYTSERFNYIFTNQKNIIYNLRNSILMIDVNNQKDLVKFINYFTKILSDNIIFTCNNYNYETIKCLYKDIIDIDSCYSKNINEFKNNLYTSIFGKVRSNFSGKISTLEVKNYVNRMRYVYLRIIDDYWVSHFDTLELLKKKMMTSLSGDVFKEYEKEANHIFTHELLPSIFNEMIAYSVNPSLKYGEYEMQYSIDTNKESNMAL